MICGRDTFRDADNSQGVDFRKECTETMVDCLHLVVDMELAGLIETHLNDVTLRRSDDHALD